MRDGVFRLLMVAARKYASTPDGRPSLARVVLSAAINLYADETSTGEAATACAEIVSDVVQAERRRERGLRA